MDHQLNKESINLLMGIKIRKLRQEKGYSLSKLANASGLSISYLSEIEKGKKYPSVEKLISLSKELGISFQDLASINTDQEGFNGFHNSMLNSFPFQHFDISANDLLPVINNGDTNLAAFIRTLHDVVQTYDTNVDIFLLTALRSLQMMKLNHFEDIEDSVTSFKKRFPTLLNSPTTENLTECLYEHLNINIEYRRFESTEEFVKIRSVFKSEPQNTIYINKELSDQQIRFILAKECGYLLLNITKRAQTTPDIHMESFDEVLNNFRASYFASALLMDKTKMKKDLTTFFSKKTWSDEGFWALIEKYDVTPETFFHRMSQLLPKEFGITDLYSLRIHHNLNTNLFVMTKELNFTEHFSPKAVKDEHYCRRWTPIRLLQNLNKDTNKPYQLVAERVKKVNTEGSFFNISYAHSSSVRSKSNVSFTLGFHINDKACETLPLVTSPSLETKFINETCQRCPLPESECSDRVAPPLVHNDRLEKEKLRDKLDAFIAKLD